MADLLVARVPLLDHSTPVVDEMVPALAAAFERLDVLAARKRLLYRRDDSAQPLLSRFACINPLEAAVLVQRVKLQI
jgi:hypothetical protein